MLKIIIIFTYNINTISIQSLFLAISPIISTFWIKKQTNKQTKKKPLQFGLCPWWSLGGVASATRQKIPESASAQISKTFRGQDRRKT